MTDRLLLEFDGAQKRYGEVLALSVQRFELRQGARILVHGGNGSGKSTLLRVIAGITQLSAGTLTRGPEYLRLRVVLVPQNGGVFPHLTVREHLEIWGRLYDRRVADPAISPHIARLGLLNLLERRVRDLSGGFQRLVALASALCVNPDGLLLDEPFNGLDVRKTEDLASSLERLAPRLAFMLVTGHRESPLPFLTGALDLGGG